MVLNLILFLLPFPFFYSGIISSYWKILISEIVILLLIRGNVCNHLFVSFVWFSLVALAKRTTCVTRRFFGWLNCYYKGRNVWHAGKRYLWVMEWLGCGMRDLRLMWLTTSKVQVFTLSLLMLSLIFRVMSN